MVRVVLAPRVAVVAAVGDHEVERGPVVLVGNEGPVPAERLVRRTVVGPGAEVADGDLHPAAAVQPVVEHAELARVRGRDRPGQVRVVARRVLHVQGEEILRVQRRLRQPAAAVRRPEPGKPGGVPGHRRRRPARIDRVRRQLAKHHRRARRHENSRRPPPAHHPPPRAEDALTGHSASARQPQATPNWQPRLPPQVSALSGSCDRESFRLPGQRAARVKISAGRARPRSSRRAAGSGQGSPRRPGVHG